MRKVMAVTVGRSDWGIYRPILRAIQSDPQLELRLVVSGAHLTPDSGWTVNEIQDDGFACDHRVDMLLAADTPAAIARSMGLGTIGFSDVYARDRPDILLVLGDRFEMHTAAVAAVPFRIPIAHVHGGEITQGAIDDVMRHAITKYSHLHFASTPDHANRIVQLGESPERVINCGAPALDNFRHIEFLTRAELERRVGLCFDDPPTLVTFHPETLRLEETGQQIAALLQALETVVTPIVITRPNADPAHRLVTGELEKFCQRHQRARLVDNLGTQVYFSLMRIASMMIGNSSSGIVEAASIPLPVVNVGSRQAGRSRSQNVVDVECDRTAIVQGIQTAASPGFRHAISDIRNVYGEGNASEVIVAQLKSITLDSSLMMKTFCDLPVPFNTSAAA